MKIIGIITSLFIAIFLIVNRARPILLNLSDATFLLSLIYIIISMIIYIRNIGLFKTFAYNSYRRTVRKNLRTEKKSNKEENQDFKEKVNEKIEGIDPRDEDMLEFHEFVQQKYGVQWSSRIYIISGLVLFILSYILAYFV